jgi:creatinine amidohydrolase/Fe(II)-dependent formamide hydrolase-like protein
VIGDPRVATAEKGKAIVDAAVEAIVALIGHARAARDAAGGRSNDDGTHGGGR